MKRKKKFILILFFVFVVMFLVIRINTFTPTGAIRYECLLQGHVLSALFLQTKEIKSESDGTALVYKITFAIPYEKATATYLDDWKVIKNKNGTYSASYGVV